MWRHQSDGPTWPRCEFESSPPSSRLRTKPQVSGLGLLYEIQRGAVRDQLDHKRQCCAVQLYDPCLVVLVRGRIRPSRPTPVTFVSGMQVCRIAAVLRRQSTSAHLRPSVSPRRQPVNARDARSFCPAGSIGRRGTLLGLVCWRPTTPEGLGRGCNPGSLLPDGLPSQRWCK
jgi:hypothetical protein